MGGCRGKNFLACASGCKKKGKGRTLRVIHCGAEVRGFDVRCEKVRGRKEMKRRFEGGNVWGGQSGKA